MVTTVGDSSRASRGPEDDDPDGPDDELPAPGRGLFLNLLRKSFSACPSAPRSHCSVVRKADPAMIIRPEFFRKSRREAPMGSSEGLMSPVAGAGAPVVSVWWLETVGSRSSNPDLQSGA